MVPVPNPPNCAAAAGSIFDGSMLTQSVPASSKTGDRMYTTPSSISSCISPPSIPRSIVMSIRLCALSTSASPEKESSSPAADTDISSSWWRVSTS